MPSELGMVGGVDAGMPRGLLTACHAGIGFLIGLVACVAIPGDETSALLLTLPPLMAVGAGISAFIFISIDGDELRPARSRQANDRNTER